MSIKSASHKSSRKKKSVTHKLHIKAKASEHMTTRNKPGGPL